METPRTLPSPAITFTADNAPEMFRRLLDTTVWVGLRLAVEYTALTLAPATTVRDLTFDQIDARSGLWHARRRKDPVPVRTVPLPTQALDVLDRARALNAPEQTSTQGPSGRLAFPAADGNRMPHFRDRSTNLFRQANVQGTLPMFRPAFRAWAAASTDASPGVAADVWHHYSMPLSPAPPGTGPQAMLDRRGALLQAWADHVTGSPHWPRRTDTQGRRAGGARPY